MAKRKVHGRRKAEFDGKIYIIEMRQDGIYVRRKHYREAVHISFNTIIKYSKPQLELEGLTYGLDQSDQDATVSAVPIKYSKPQLELPNIEFTNELSSDGSVGTEVRQADSAGEVGPGQIQ
jgi:hypothetical protein